MRRMRGAEDSRNSGEVTRRNFLRAGGIAAGAAGLTLLDAGWLPANVKPRAKRCIILFLVGGPSQLETWDPKPDAPEDIRGPFRSMRTNIPGMQICEHFPRMACMADKYAIIRTVYHDAQPIHETGQQLLQTGLLSPNAEEHPNIGAVLSHLLGRKPPHALASVLLPGPIGNTGVAIGHGQSAGWLGPEHAPKCLDVDPEEHSRWEIERYGNTPFGQACLEARRLIEQGARLVTVNMFDTVFNEVTWDCHADGGSLAATLDDYKNTLCPMFDRAYSGLLEDLSERALLEETLVVAMGEFGRTPHFNYRGGRDHWTKCWSVLFAGGGVRGGQVIGRSDAHAAEPLDRPVHASGVAASIYHAVGIDARRAVRGSGVRTRAIVDAAPVFELF
jgi:uncharacterized protein (DUF1501 family)